MENKLMFKTEHSCIAIKEDKLYIVSLKYKDFSSRAITITSGFQIELGRRISDIKTALKETRLPIIIKEVTNVENISHYQIIRMHTGKVDDKVIATIICNNDIMSSLSFNKSLLKDGGYRKYNQVSVLHQLSIPYELQGSGCTNRRDQVYKIFKSIMPITNMVEVIESNKQLKVITNEDELRLSYKFVSNTKNNDRYELVSISLN